MQSNWNAHKWVELVWRNECENAVRLGGKPQRDFTLVAGFYPVSSTSRFLLCRDDSIDSGAIIAFIPATNSMLVCSALFLSIASVDLWYTDLLGLRLIVHGVPLLSLEGRVRHSPLTLSKLLRLANSSVRHRGCWDGVGGCRVGGWCWRLMCGLASGVWYEGLWEAQALPHVMQG